MNITMDASPYTVKLQDVVSGRVVDIAEDGDNWYSVDSDGEVWDSEFIWSEGNMACDCNRHLKFIRATENRGPDLMETSCGVGKFKVLGIFLADGKMVYSEATA